MQQINRESKTTIYFGVSYLLGMPWAMDRVKSVDFQKALLDAGLDFEQTGFRGNSFTLGRGQPAPLQIKFESPGPEISALHILSQNPQYGLDMFVRDAQAVTNAYQQTFAPGHCQIIQSSAKIEHLYSCTDHAFKYLWEDRLRQSPHDLGVLGQRPVAGGGLRLVMPPYKATEQEAPHSVEIRIESAMREARKLLVETVFVWPQPMLVKEGQRFEPGLMLETIENYAANEVWQFLAGKPD